VTVLSSSKSVSVGGAVLASILGCFGTVRESEPANGRVSCTLKLEGLRAYGLLKAWYCNHNIVSL
jgi:hypothetical protein